MIKINFGVPLPPKEMGGRQNLVKNETNQSCSKLLEMVRKLVKNIFGFVGHPPHKKNVGGGIKQKVCQNEEEKVVHNYLKWQENWSLMIFWIFYHPPLLNKRGGGQQICGSEI